MANESQRMLRLGALVVPIVLAAAGGKWAVDATRTKGVPSSALPSPQELDSLRGYVVRTNPPAVAVSSPANPVYAAGASDPFAKVNRWETPRYVPEEPGSSGRAVPTRWIVSTIMITDSRRVAVVNGSLVSPGSLLSGGARVLSIESDHVVIAEPGGARRQISVQGGAN